MNEEAIELMRGRVNKAFSHLHTYKNWEDIVLKDLYVYFYLQDNGAVRDITTEDSSFDKDWYTLTAVEQIRDLFWDWFLDQDVELLSQYFTEHEVMEMYK